MMANILKVIRDRFAPSVPSKCPACKDESTAKEPLGNSRYLCIVCSKDFSAVLDADGDWVCDDTPVRHVLRRAALQRVQ